MALEAGSKQPSVRICPEAGRVCEMTPTMHRGPDSGLAVWFGTFDYCSGKKEFISTNSSVSALNFQSFFCFQSLSLTLKREITGLSGLGFKELEREQSAAFFWVFLNFYLYLCVYDKKHHKSFIILMT